MQTAPSGVAEAHQEAIAALGGPPVGFAALGLDESLMAALRKANFHTPTDIQRELIPPALAGRDCLGQAKTGTGKTAAFALPMLQRVESGRGFQALVLVPTRELASQVDEHVSVLGEFHPVRTALVYGGRRISQQMDRLKHNPEIIIGTPGRVLDLMGRKLIDVSKVTLVVLDEVDRMLDIGFRDDIRKILRAVTAPHQTIFVSATIDADIRKLATSFMHEPLEINVSRDTLTVEGIDQSFVSVDPRDKFATLLGLLRHEKPTLCIVFTNTKHTARRVAEKLRKQHINCKEIHGDLVQSRREKVMQSFRNADIHVLVATDLASRGLDVMEISHIINYDLPDDPAVYVHRIGRTARAGQKGIAISLATREDGKTLTEIEKLINHEVRPLEATWIERTHWQEAAPPQPVAPVSAAAPGADRSTVPMPARFAEPVRRDELFDALGFQPQRRTLGSRFRAQRRNKPLRK